jgi:hypothetical protein
MPIKVLLADGSDFMRMAIVRLLMEEPAVEFVGRLQASLRPSDKLPF